MVRRPADGDLASVAGEKRGVYRESESLCVEERETLRDRVKETVS